MSNLPSAIRLGVIAERAAEIVERTYAGAFYEDFLDCIFVEFLATGEAEIQFVFGKNGDTWAGDINDGSGRSLGVLMTDISSKSEDPAEIAAAIVAAIKPKYRVINGNLFVFNSEPADDELFCDECGYDVTRFGCWSAEVEGAGASGMIVLCKDCIEKPDPREAE